MGGERGQGTRDVGLVEVDGTSAPTGPPDVEAAGPLSIRDVWWRRHQWWLASGLVVAIVAGFSVVHAVQVRMRLAGLAGVSGIAAPIDEPVHERWSTDASVQESGGVLLAQNAGDVWEVSASGVELRNWTGLQTDTGHWLTRTAGGHVLWTTYGQVAAPSEDATGGTVFSTDDTSVITDLGEGTAFALEHQVPWTAIVDDGSAPDLLLVAGADPVAYDLRTGNPIWRVHHEIDAFVVLDGTVYAAGTGTVSPLDARTGAARWSVRTGTSLNRGALETDGRSLVLVTVRAGDSVSTVEALDLTDGSASWTSTLSHAFDVLQVLGGDLAVVSYTDAGRITVLG